MNLTTSCKVIRFCSLHMSEGGDSVLQELQKLQRRVAQLEKE